MTFLRTFATSKTIYPLLFMTDYIHLTALLPRNAERFGTRVALSAPTFVDGQSTGVWREYSWNAFHDTAQRASLSLLALGVGVQEHVGVCAQNMPEILFTDFGCFGIRAVSVPMYATSSEAQLQYIINDATIRVLFVGEQEQYDKAVSILPLCPTLEYIIYFDKEVRPLAGHPNTLSYDQFLALGDTQAEALRPRLDTLLSEANLDDLCNILYTSGTTGDSKGVTFTYRNVGAQIEAHKILPITHEDVVMNFLPLSHIFERGWTYISIATGIHCAVNRRPTEILQSLQEVRPTCMSAVPRFWEKVYQGVLDKAEASPIATRTLIARALKVRGEYVAKYKSQGKEAPLWLALQNAFFEKTVIKKLKTTLGLDRGNIFPTAGATVSPAIEIFAHAAGINMVVGYGLTESTATVSCDRSGQPFTIGSVGRVLSHLEVRISPEGEVLLRGDSITPGYYKKEEANRQAFTEDGFFRTGDAGYLVGDELFLTDRIKDLFKTSNGKYIAPQMIETKLTVDRYIDQAVIIANERRFVSALIVPNYKALEDIARSKNLVFGSSASLCKLPEIVAFMQERIETLQQEFASYEKIKAFRLLPEPLTMERGELTNTLKVKRPVVNQNYATLIDEMYAV